MPLPATAIVSPWAFPRRLGARRILEIGRIGNPWDRDVALKEALGFREREERAWPDSVMIHR